MGYDYNFLSFSDVKLMLKDLWSRRYFMEK